ncbi:MAG: hypothetical protein IT186_00550 [Acidobacteria bacterium]|nr:hypothetical protein [Acidobacteriota bacterium]MCG3194796.1 hypothetical protein [Thermoanaerobaculia bacterium]MCK6685511.1 hypothetical protein [Thermoanaerobaculia bacterium]
MSDRKYRQKGYQDSSGAGPRPSGGGFSDAPRRIEGAPRGRGAERNREEVFRCKLCGELAAPDFAPSAECNKCKAPLHACNQCKFFDTSARFQCRQPLQAPFESKTKKNDCFLFEPATMLDLTGKKATAATPDDARAAFDRLFKK